MLLADAAEQQSNSRNEYTSSYPDLGDLVGDFLDEAARGGGLGEAILEPENRERLVAQLRPRFATHFKELFLLIPWMAFAFSWISGIVMGLMVQVVIHTIVHTSMPVTWMWVLITTLVAIACGGLLGILVKGRAEKSILASLREMGAKLGPEDRATWKRFKAFTQR